MFYKLSESEVKELNYKLDAVREFMLARGGLKYKVYNHGCPAVLDEPDSNIVEYFDDIICFINRLLIKEPEVNQDYYF